MIQVVALKRLYEYFIVHSIYFFRLLALVVHTFLVPLDTKNKFQGMYLFISDYFKLIIYQNEISFQ